MAKYKVVFYPDAHNGQQVANVECDFVGTDDKGNWVLAKNDVPEGLPELIFPRDNVFYVIKIQGE